jgi:hypothetical protein
MVTLLIDRQMNWFLLATFLALVVVFPIVLSLTLIVWAIYQFMNSLGGPRVAYMLHIKRLYECSTFFISWSSLDVFLIALVVTGLEIHKIPEAITDNKDIPATISSKGEFNVALFLLLAICGFQYIYFWLLRENKFKKEIRAAEWERPRSSFPKGTYHF